MGKKIFKIWQQCWANDFWLRFLTLTSMGLIITSFFTPPMFIIDGSVMLGVGELEIFGVIWEFDKAMDKNLSTKLKIKQIELDVNNEKCATNKTSPVSEIDEEV